MSLGSLLQIGRSALITDQAAISVTGNNLANAATPGYHQQTIDLEPASDEQVQAGVFLGRGVQIQQIVRQVDEGLESRLNNSISDQAASTAQQSVLTQVQSLEGELSSNSLSTQLSSFFNNWSQLANNPQDDPTRANVVQQGQALVSFIQNLQSGLTNLQTQTNTSITSTASTVDGLLTQVQQIDAAIAQQGGGSSGANDLADQRDSVIQQLAKYMDISTVQQASGSVDVYVGSTPVVLGGVSQGVEIKQQTVNGEVQTNLVLKSDGTVLNPASGQLGAMIQSDNQDIGGAIDALNSFTGQLINQVNLVYSQGQGATGFSSVTGASQDQDPTAALDSPTTGLSLTPQNGSFVINVTQQSTGTNVASTINVNLGGTDPSGDTSLQDLVTQLNAVPNITASVTGDGRLKIVSNSSDYTVSFSDDTSGALAALGVNTFFTGSDASNVAVNNTVVQNPDLLAAGQGLVQGDNSNALAVAGLQDQNLASLGGASLSDLWSRHVEDYAQRLNQANQNVESDTTVQQNLSTQQQSVSGVNSDEEAINLLSFQRAYQGSARFLSVVDEMIQTLLAIQ